MSLLGGIEAGGTKFVCAVGEPGRVSAEIRFPTTKPDETIAQAVAFFEQQQREKGPISAVGIAAFGPLDPNPKSDTFGYITTTPKPHWGNVDLAGAIVRALDVPIAFDTDVNGAALGEFTYGAGKDVDNLIYITIGTGIGGGIIANGRIVHGLVHPEMGHIHMARDPERDPYLGRCPYHGDCFEGLAAGPAIGERWGKPAYELPADHPAWELEADYIAQALQTFICTLSPERIILGGGVMQQPQLFPLVRQKTLRLLNGYVQHPRILDDIDSYIVPPGLGNQAGAIGALALAELALA